VRERLGIDDITLILQQNRLHVLQKEDTDRVRKCVEYEVEGSRPKRGCGERLCQKRLISMQFEQGGCYGL